MNAAVMLGAAVALALIDVVATVRIVRSEALTREQKVAWLCFVWLVPLVGALLGLQVASDSQAPAKSDGSVDADAPLTPGLHVAGSSYTGGGGLCGCACGSFVSR